MFNENFSFGSSPHHAAVEDCTSAEISPFTSRCPSPQHSPRTPATHRDSRFDAYRYNGRSHHPAITALTAQLQSQALDDTEMRSPSPPPSEITSPTVSAIETDADEGFCDGSDTPATSISDFSFESIDFDPTLWDLSMSDNMTTTPSLRPSLSLEAQALSSYTMRRRQRQALVRLQCLVTRAPDLAMLLEECHPSSLPLETDTVRAYPAKGQSETSAGLSGLGLSNATRGSRVEKDRGTAAVRRTPRMRKRVSTT